jgi:hypothetical protein
MTKTCVLDIKTKWTDFLRRDVSHTPSCEYSVFKESVLYVFLSKSTCLYVYPQFFQSKSYVFNNICPLCLSV